MANHWSWGIYCYQITSLTENWFPSNKFFHLKNKWKYLQKKTVFLIGSGNRRKEQFWYRVKHKKALMTASGSWFQCPCVIHRTHRPNKTIGRVDQLGWEAKWSPFLFLHGKTLWNMVLPPKRQLWKKARKRSRDRVSSLGDSDYGWKWRTPKEWVPSDHFLSWDFSLLDSFLRFAWKSLAMAFAREFSPFWEYKLGHEEGKETGEREW